jgi:glutamate/aspartate transport system substrate-binding protein
MLESGRADAFMMDEVLLAGEKPKAKILMNGSMLVYAKKSFEIYGCG